MGRNRRALPGSRTSSKVDPSAVRIHRNANGGIRKDPVSLYPKQVKPKKAPQHTRDGWESAAKAGTP
jgi:hypothetical protein